MQPQEITHTPDLRNEITRTNDCVFLKFKTQAEANEFVRLSNLPLFIIDSVSQQPIPNPDGNRIPCRWIVRLIRKVKTPEGNEIDAYESFRQNSPTIALPAWENINLEPTSYSQAQEINYRKPYPGYVFVGDQQVFCGVRVLSKAENPNYPFDLNELKAIAANQIVWPTNHNQGKKENIIRLAHNILWLYENKIDFHQHTSRHKVTKDKIYTPKKEGANTSLNLQQEDIIEATRLIASENPGKKIAILNPANRTHLGGGAFLGANALEEIYFRSSLLVVAYAEHAREEGFKYTSYGNSARPDYTIGMALAEAWFTPAVLFTQHPINGSYEAYSLEKQFRVGIIGSTAKDYNTQADADTDPNNEEIMKAEIEALLVCAIENGVEIPVFTAHGCGAFNNNPTTVARYFNELLYGDKNYSRYFDAVHFVIWDAPNYQAFKGYFTEQNPLINIIEPDKRQDPSYKPTPVVVNVTQQLGNSRQTTFRPFNPASPPPTHPKPSFQENPGENEKCVVM